MPIILGTKVDNIGLKLALKKIKGFLADGKQHYIVTPNPEIVLYASLEKNSDFRRFVLNQADLNIPDGIGLLLASWVLASPLWCRITGTDLMQAICQLSAEKGWRIFLFGGEQGVALECQKKLERRFSGLKIVRTAVGKCQMSNVKCQMSKIQNQDGNLKFKNQIHDEQLAVSQVVNFINNTKPDILFVALGSPKQEQFIAENLKNMPTVKLAMGVGGAFDFISERVKRAPLFFRQLGLEWLWRFFIQPWRAKRIFNATIKFLLAVIKWRFRMTFMLRQNIVACIIKELVYHKIPHNNVQSGFLNSANRLSGIEIFLVKRANSLENHWQFPQGGIDKRETAEQALAREVFEELGLSHSEDEAHSSVSLQPLKKIKNFYRYIWPKEYRLYQGFRGQKQTLFILEWQGDDSLFKLDQKELADFKWVAIDNLIEKVHTIRKEQAERVLEELKNEYYYRYPLFT